MITGAHAIVYTRDADADRAFFRDVLGFDSVDAGGGWLIFKLPPAELAAHPDETGGRHELYLMCDDVHATVAELEAKGVEIVARGDGRGLRADDRDPAARRGRARAVRAAPPQPAVLDR